MFGWQQFRIRHPFYPGLRVTMAAKASGDHAVVAGSISELEEAASRGARASHAVYLLLRDDSPFATAWERERLWTWFRVPAYVLVLDRSGKLVAFECEAQEDLHLATSVAPTDEGSLCRCGRPGPRVQTLSRTTHRTEPLPVPDRVSA
jgi:hypothetical protein